MSPLSVKAIDKHRLSPKVSEIWDMIKKRKKGVPMIGNADRICGRRHFQDQRPYRFSQNQPRGKLSFISF